MEFWVSIKFEILKFRDLIMFRNLDHRKMVFQNMFLFKSFKLREAADYLRGCPEDCRIWAEEVGNGGVRTFGVMRIEDFVNQYLNLKSRHFYEVITEGLQMKLYMDVDVSLELTDIRSPGRLLVEFMEFISRRLIQDTKELVATEDWVFLNSSSSKKKSYHLVLDHEKIRFKSIQLMKVFVTSMIKEYEESGRSLRIRGDSDVRIVDTSVYKKSQNLRIFLSSKFNNHAILRLDSRDEKIFVLADENKLDITKEVLMSSLITVGSRNPVFLEDFGSYSEVCMVKSSSYVLPRGGGGLELPEALEKMLKGLARDRFDSEVKYSSKKGDMVFMILKPPLECPYQKRVHSRNNTYLAVNLKKMSWYLLCHGSMCGGRDRIYFRLRVEDPSS